MTEPLISVIIPAWNRQNYLDAALDSVFAQGRTDLDIVVIDDGSTDATPQLARARAGVRLVMQPHQGVGAARNRGLAETRAPLVAFLDSDDWWEPRKLDRQLAALQARPEAGLVTAVVRHVLGAGQECPSWLPPEKLMADPNRFFLQACLIRRAVFEQVGAFRTDVLVGEDLDWFLRVRAAGIDYMMLDEVLLNRRLHPGNLSFEETRQAGLELRFAALKALIDGRRANPR